MHQFFLEFWENFRHNLFKPLLLFFYMGFLVPMLGVKLDFPHIIYQGLTIYLLIAIGWHGGEELARLPMSELGQAGGFMLMGFLTNFMVGITAYMILRTLTRLRRVDAATVAGFYGSDSAGTYATCVGVLMTAKLAFAPYMPVMLAVMEIPGCLVALFLVSLARRQGMDALGNMPGEPGYNPSAKPMVTMDIAEEPHTPHYHPTPEQRALREEAEMALESVDENDNGGKALEGTKLSQDRRAGYAGRSLIAGRHSRPDGVRLGRTIFFQVPRAIHFRLFRVSRPSPAGKAEVARAERAEHAKENCSKKPPLFTPELLHEVFLNPGIYLLLAGIAIGFFSGHQGYTEEPDRVFLSLFPGLLCFFLLEMGMTASRKLRDLRQAGWRFIAYGILAPNVYATMGIMIAHAYSMLTHQHFPIGTYVLFSVLCGAASYIAVPAVQRLAIPEASPTLPLAASLGLTFSYNVTIGIPVYIQIAKLVVEKFPIS
jgi:uncharacterized protein